MSKTSQRVQKLVLAHETFNKSCLERLLEKDKEGFRGWDNKAINYWGVPRRLHDKSLDVLLSDGEASLKDLVDIANLAMMLYYRNARAKGEVDHE